MKAAGQVSERRKTRHDGKEELEEERWRERKALGRRGKAKLENLYEGRWEVRVRL